MTIDPKVLERLSRELTDKGKLIAAGFVGLQLACIPPDAPTIQIKEMRMAFMAGAQHLFASIMTILDPGAEPTDADMRRLDLIHNELDEWINDYKREHGISPPSPRTKQ